MYFDEQKLHYSTSMLTVIPANYPHMTVSDGENTNFWEYLFFNPERIIHDIYPDNSICQREMIELVNRRAMIMHENDAPKLVDIVKTIMEEMRNKKPHYIEAVRSLEKAMLIEIIRLDEQKTNKFMVESARTIKNTIIITVLKYVNQHYELPLRVSELADVCNMSETHFRRLFEENVNMSPMEYVNLVRIQKACDLIRKTNDSMDTIAGKCGFTTTSTFNRNFKKFLSTSPYQWKNDVDNYERKLLNSNISTSREG